LADGLKVRFWGVRGSFAMSGREFLRYGGNTTSVELITGAKQRLLIDLGTGVRRARAGIGPPGAARYRHLISPIPTSITCRG
jgi:phosphoribosyl 1,2-cyclic phosphodiesterase